MKFFEVVGVGVCLIAAIAVTFKAIDMVFEFWGRIHDYRSAKEAMELYKAADDHCSRLRSELADANAEIQRLKESGPYR